MVHDMYFARIRANKSFVDEKLRVCVYITYFNLRVGSTSTQFVLKQLPAGAISYSIGTTLA